ncbi:MAG: hypothetical protein JWO45_2121 [Spartobacteria bacterium]|nr:hypothetical protein [Spartobacteria bacterium]
MQPFRSRRVCGRTTAVFLSYIVLVLIFALAGRVLGKGGKGGKGGKKKGNTAIPSATPANGEQSLTNIPLPIGHEAKGLVLPDFDLEGHLRGKFVAGSARRIDEEHVGFRDLKITTFTDENKIDLQIDMQTSVLDLKTRVLTSQERTTVKRADFNIVGDSVEFDTGTRTGRMVGNVKMVISDQSHLMEKTNQ